MSGPVNLDELLHQAALAFQAAAGDSATLSHPEVLKEGRRSRVLRCQVTSARSEITSVIVKQIREEAPCGFSDWASLAFLSGIPEAQGLVPRFLGGDIPNRLFLIEDWGTGNNLQSLLTGSDPAASRAALAELASQMARLHAATLGKEDAFEAIRSALPETNGLGRQAEAERWRESRGKILDWFTRLDGALPSRFDAALNRIFDVYRHPGPFLAFTHGDPAPTNNHFANGQARLLDFEYGGFRHALYDITGWNILCPLPADCVREMRDLFREELAKTCPAARDEARFAQEWAALCAYRALAMLTWISPEDIQGNWADGWTRREAVFVAVSRLKEVTAPFAELAALSEAAAALAQSLQRQWPEFPTIEDALPRWAGL